jgi:hypothetical protein
MATVVGALLAAYLILVLATTLFAIGKLVNALWGHRAGAARRKRPARAPRANRPPARSVTGRSASVSV